MKKLLTSFFFIPFCIQAQISDSIKSEYDYVSELKRGVAIFRDHQNNYGLLNHKGQKTTTNKYDYITFTHNKYNYIQASKKINGKFKRGYLNVDGTEEIPLKYDNLYRFSKTGLIIALNNNKFGAIDSLNNEIIPFKFKNIQYADDNGNYYLAKQSELYAVYNNKGLPITDLKFSDISFFKNNYATVTLPNNSGTIIDTKGNFLFPPIINHNLQFLSETYFKIINNKTKLVGLIDTTGKILVPCNYEDINYANRTVVVKKNNKYGLRSINDTEITPLVYDYIIIQSGIFQTKQNHLYGAITSSGETILPTIYNIVLFINDDKYIITKKDEKFGVFSRTGNNIIPLEYNFFRYSDHKIFAEKNSNPVIINLKEPNNITYIKANSFVKDDLSLIYETWNKQIFEENGKQGVISIDNEILIPAEYDNIKAIYTSGEFVVKKANKYGIINYNNEIIKPIKYDKITIKKEHALLEIKNSKNESYNVRFREPNTDLSPNEQ